MYVGLISLGCAKNRVDSEEVLSFFARNDFQIVSDPNLADILVVNTCGFIEQAKNEAIETIFDTLKYHKFTVVIGCLVERYYSQLLEEIPEVDLFVPIREYKNFGKLLNEAISKKKQEGKLDASFGGELELTKRIYSTPSYQAYLQISDGCNNCCTYCAIPLIRGGFRSYPLEELKITLDDLEKKGIKEVVVISQDTTRYGSDLVGQNINICTLLKEVLKHECFEFVRLLYLYPDEITDELIDLFRDNPRLTPYFDVPIQHSEDRVLKLMNRRGSKEDLINLFRKIREKVPHAILRTTLIVGFPHEKREDVINLDNFIREIKFDHLGVFKYSREEDTKSYSFDEQVSEREKTVRYNKIMKTQAQISYKLNQKRIGEVIDVLITEFDEDNYCYSGVCYLFAPDDIDGKLYVYSKDELEIGKTYKAKIINADIYDLDAEII